MSSLSMDWFLVNLFFCVCRLLEFEEEYKDGDIIEKVSYVLGFIL